MSIRITRRRQNGLTLIELVMFIIIVGVGVAGILSVMNVTTRNSADPLMRKQALAIAESMMEEIQLKDFANPAGGFTGASTQGNRPLFDDVSDYNGFATSGIKPAEGGNTNVSGLGSYSISVAVSGNAGGDLGITASEAKKIAIVVTDPSGTELTMTGYRADY